MATLDDFRQLPQYKDFSDEQLVVTLSQKYGIEPGEIAQEFGVSHNPQRNPLGAGLSAGVDQLQGLGYGAIGAGARALGAESVADWADRGVERNYAESAFNGRSDLERIEDQSLGSALPFLGYQVAKQVPMLAGTLAASAAVPQAAIPAALSRGLAVIPKGLGGGGLKAGMDFAGRRAALEAGNAFGRTIAASYPIGVGAMYGEAVERGDPTQGDALAALGLGVPYGAAEAVMPSMVRNAFGSNAARFAGGLPTRLAKAGGLGFAGEAGTELFQNELEMGFAGDLTQDEIDSRRLNSAVIGGLVGGTFNLPAGFRGQRNPADPIDILNRDTSPQAPTAPAAGLNLTNLAVPQQGIFNDPSQVEQWAGIVPAPTAEQHASRAEDILAAFNTPVGEVGGRPVTAWEAFQREQGVPANRIQPGPAQIKESATTTAPKIDIPVPQPLQSDPVRSAVAQASPATLRKDGTLKDIVEKALGAYSEFSDGEIAAALEEFAASKRKDTVWRVAALEAIARQRAAQGAGAVPAGSAGNTPSGPVVLDGVRQSAGAPAPGSAAAIPVGEPVVQQPSGLTEGAQPTNVPPTQQVAPQAQTARGQEGAQVGVHLRPTHRNQVVPDAVQVPKLAQVQQQVFDHLIKAVRENRMDDIVDAEGVFQYAKIGAALGKKRGSIKAAVDGAVRRIAQSQGLSVEQFQDALRQRAVDNRRVTDSDYSALGLSPDQQISVADNADVFGNDEGVSPSMEIVDSPAKTNSGGLDAETLGGTEEGDAILREVGALTSRGLTEANSGTDPVAERRAKEAQARRDQLEAEMAALNLEAEMTLAEVNWDSTVEDAANKIRAPKFAELPSEAQLEFALVSREYEAGGIDEETMVDEIRAIAVEVKSNGYPQEARPAESRAVAQAAGAVQSPAVERTESPRTEGVGQDAGAREEVTPTNPLEARVAALRDLDLGEKQSARLDKLVARYQNREIDAERLGEELQVVEENAFPEEKGGKGMRYSRAPSGQGTTVEAVLSAINAIATPMGRRKFTVYQTADEAVRNGGINPKYAKGTQGWVDAKGNAFFIADNIRPGNELAVVLHEIGVHLGIENLLTDKQYETLVKKIFDWAQSDANTQESRIARAALARVDSAKLENEADLAPETIAYFVEEAVKAGVNPTAMQYKTELDRWFRTLWAAFKVALRRLNLINADRLTAQNVVDLAYGAARIELASTYHGTAANFRRFDHRFMGSGEGAQAFGWGTYLAQRFGIANEYFEADVRRKSDGEKVLVWGDGTALTAKEIGDIVTLADLRLYSSITRKLAQDWQRQAREKLEAHKEVVRQEDARKRLRAKAQDDELEATRALRYANTEEDRARAQKKLDEARNVLSATKAVGNLWALSSAESDIPVLEKLLDRGVMVDDPAPEGNIHITDINATEDELLDWDKPLSEQTAVNELLLNNLDVDLMDKANLRESDTGKAAYRRLERELGSDKAVSEYLDSLGVKGIKFLDAMSRQPSRDDRRIDFLKSEIANLEAEMQDEAAYAGNALVLDGVRSNNRERRKQIEKYKDELATLTPSDKTRNLVIFNDANIFRVGSMRGGPVDKGGRMMFSKIDTSTPEGFFDAIRNRTADFFINPVGFMKEHGLGWLTLEQLADVVKSKSVSGYHRVMVAMQQFSKDRVHDAALIDVEWAKLSPNEQSRLSTVMRGATRASYDPENEAPANDEQRTLNDQYEALTPAAKDIYLKVREYYSKNFEERKKILLDAANRAKAAGKNTSEVERMFAKVKGPYFPLMRIGGWYSVGMSPELADLMDKKERNEASAAELKRIETLRKDAKHYVSRGHTTRRDAELSRRELQAQLGVAYANRAEERIGQELAQLPDMAKLEEYLAPHLPPEVRGQVRDMLAQAYFDALPEKSALKRQLKREGVHGEEEDMRRVFAASALSSAHHISRLKYANDLSEAMVKVRAEGRRDETLRMVGNELNKRTALALERQENPIVDRVLQVSYFANLGLSPAFLLTNMTQVPMITAPWLGARHGFAKATRALAEAFTDTKDMVRATYAGKGVKDGWRSEFDWSQKYPEGTDEHKLFRELLDRNLLDITMEHDLTAVAEVRNTKIDDAIKIANLPVRVTETVNRSITGLAAYRLARADGKSHEQAVEHAAKALSETQLNYSGLNTARHMQVVLGSKALARLMMQFRKFQQGMVYLIVKNAYDAVKAQGGTEAETKELRRIARKTLAGVFGTTGLMAGTLGLPFAGTVAMVVGAVGGMLDDDDEPFDPVVEYRNFLTDMFGPEMAAVLAKGLPTLMNVDLSKRVGMGDIGTPLPFMRQGRTGTEAVNNTLGAAAGAWAGTTASMLDGIAFLANGDYAKAAEKIIPIKAAQNLVRGYRYDDQGLTNRNGELVVPAEKFSAWDIALRTAGFQPMREAEYYEANQAVEGAKRAAQDTRTKLLRQYAQAKLRGEPTADVDAEIKVFNGRHPQKGLRIDYSARARAVQARRKMADERNEAGVRVDRTGALFEDRGRFAAP